MGILMIYFAFGGPLFGAMLDWGMATAGIQIDPEHPTGRVEVRIENHEPSYQILADCAYDFIAAETLSSVPTDGMVYHGTLGLRNPVSRNAFAKLAEHQPGIPRENGYCESFNGKFRDE